MSLDPVPLQRSIAGVLDAVTWRMADDSKPLRLNPSRRNFTAKATHATAMKHGRRRAAAMTLATQTSIASAVAAAADPQADALRCIYNSTAGDMWTNRGGWNSNNSICSWWGVQCNGTAVTALNLGGNNLQGSIEPCFETLPMLQQLSDFNRLTRNASCTGI